MKSILLPGAMLLVALTSFSQKVNFHISYLSDIHAGKYWYNERGANFGLTANAVQFENLPLNWSLRYNATFTGSKDNTRIDHVLFDLPDSIDNKMGFARAEFKKFGFSVDYDLGYSEFEDDFFVPYVTFGPRLESYSSSVHYELYQPNSCPCYNTTDEPLENTLSLGYNTGLGIKLRFFSGFTIDFRANYYGGWSLLTNENVLMAEASSFNIDVHGNPGFNRSNKRYNDGFHFSVGVIIPFKSIWADGDNSDSYSYSDDSDDDDDFFDTPSSESGSSSGGSSGCESGGLSPAGRGGGND